MGFIKRLFGICATKPPADIGCWEIRNGDVVLDISKVPEIAEKGSAVRLEGKNLDKRVLVVHGEDGNYYAFENRCTHAGRRIDPLSGESSLECCSIGKTTFDYSGKAIKGSSDKPIALFETELCDGKLVVRLS